MPCEQSVLPKELLTQSDLSHLRWMLQKDLLKQDMFLLGPPGNFRRAMAMRYAALLRREVYVVAVSRDTTEADLKQRKEIRGGNASFTDQAPVVAALTGGLLILDGIEKAERNVLPTLNNLLENREMQLEDGRFIMSPKQFDKLLAEGETADSLAEKLIVRAHDDFRVIALGVPVPPYKGKPLDPPLRSRFQCRVVNDFRGAEIWSALMAFSTQVPAFGSLENSITSEKVRGVVSRSSGDGRDVKSVAGESRVSEKLKEAASVVEAVKALQFSKEIGMQLQDHFPDTALEAIAKVVCAFPEEDMAAVLGRHFPIISPTTPPDDLFSPEQQRAREMYLAVLDGHSGFAVEEDVHKSNYLVEEVNHDEGFVSFLPASGTGDRVVVPADFSKEQQWQPPSEECGFGETRMFAAILQDILVSLSFVSFGLD